MSALDRIAVVRNPHYERLGGLAAVRALVEAFYAAMDRRDDARAIRALHAPDLGPTKTVLVAYLCEWLGGPRDYSARRGPPRLRRVHAPFALDAAAATAWLACMDEALGQVCGDAALHAELMAAFRKIALHLAEPNARPHLPPADPPSPRSLR